MNEQDEKIAELIAAIKHYEQADEDGVFVKVSRQACDEAAAELARRYNELKSEREKRLRAEEWQPIETAPQDGSLLLLGWWETWPTKQWRCEVEAAGTLDTARQGRGYSHGRATHWMPLPEPAPLPESALRENENDE